MKLIEKSITSDLIRLDAISDNLIDYSDILPLDESFLVKEPVKISANKDDLVGPNRTDKIE